MLPIVGGKDMLWIILGAAWVVAAVLILMFVAGATRCEPPKKG